MSQIRDKKAHRKRIATLNPINTKSVELQYLIFEKSNKVENEKKELNKCKYNP